MGPEGAAGVSDPDSSEGGGGGTVGSIGFGAAVGGAAEDAGVGEAVGTVGVSAGAEGGGGGTLGLICCALRDRAPASKNTAKNTMDAGRFMWRAD